MFGRANLFLEYAAILKGNTGDEEKRMENLKAFIEQWNETKTDRKIQTEVIIENAAMEPEISDLCHFLSKAGVSFRGVGTSTLKIKGIKHKNPININYTVIPDRIEAGTFLIASAMNGGQLRLNNVEPSHLNNVIDFDCKDIG